MITCRRAAELISEELSADLPLRRWAGLAVHTLLCATCRRYRRQAGWVKEAAAEYLQSGQPVGTSAVLPAEAKRRLKAVLSCHLDEGG